MLKVLSISTITTTRRTSIQKGTIDLLSTNIGDEVLFILGKNGIVNIRKFKEGMTLGTGEKYIYTSHITQAITRHRAHISVGIPRDVGSAINADIGDKIIWILDNDGNIILRNNVILDECSINIFHKDVGALIIGLSTMDRERNILQIPKEIIDILGLVARNRAILSLDDYDNIIVSNEIGKNLLQEFSVLGNYSAYIRKEVIDMLDTHDKILWFFDEKGNIIIKNDLLSDNCI